MIAQQGQVEALTSYAVLSGSESNDTSKEIWVPSISFTMAFSASRR
ncbi:hypothetical protein [Nonomuraea sp. NPDC048826]